MKTCNSPGLFLTITITAALVLAARNAPAQDATASGSAVQAAPQLSYGVSQIIQLSKANVSEGTIVSYIRNSGNSYGLDANQIVYLKQQGVSDPVVNAMLSQPRPVAQTASQPDSPATGSDPAATIAAPPAAAYVPAQSSTVYVIPDTQTYDYYAYSYRPYYSGYYYPYYGPVYYGGSYPGVSIGVGFGCGHWGGYHHGGKRGGWRR